MNLHPDLLKGIAQAGFSQPTGVQSRTIPVALSGRDLLVSSQTGSGKTAAFMLPALHRLATDRARRPVAHHNQASRTRSRGPVVVAAPRVLVLTPTRELALQIASATFDYTFALRHIGTATLVGGMPQSRQRQALARNPEILFATPGRLLDHARSGKIDWSGLELLVLDEADRMLDMGFVEAIEAIVGLLPQSRQTMLFSATLDGVVGKLSKSITCDPEVIRVETSATTDHSIQQRLHFVDDLAHKGRLLDHLLRDIAVEQAVVFTSTKRDAEAVAERLSSAGFAAAALHGDMQQAARNRTLDGLRKGRLRVLVATDVAARGIDVRTITHVFNFDLPRSPESYVHRIGRTGRAGRTGIAISLAHRHEMGSVRSIERFTRQQIPVEVVAGHEPRMRNTGSVRKQSPSKPVRAGQARDARARSGSRVRTTSFS
jgi:superfamily II DNA/RNA helicase